MYLAKLGGTGLVVDGARSGPDGAIGARSGPDGAIGPRPARLGPVNFADRSRGLVGSA